MKKYAPNVLKGDSKQPSTVAWTAAKAFQKALESHDRRNPTAADIKAALNTFNRRDARRACTQPDHVHRRPGPPHNSCWFFMQLKNHKLTAPDGMKTTCTP